MADYDLEYFNHTWLLQYLNQSLSNFECPEVNSSLTAELSEKGGYCNASYDSILCWPPTPLNSTAIQKCFSEFNGFKYDDTREYFSFIFSVCTYTDIILIIENIGLSLDTYKHICFIQHDHD